MKALITGASGLIGKALQEKLRGEGWELLLATRSEPKTDEQIQWDTETGFAESDLARLEGLTAVVHLAGENVSGLRWTDEKKKAILDSRVKGTKSVVDALFELEARPESFCFDERCGFLRRHRRQR